MKDFYLLLNDLFYSPEIKEIIFQNESLNKKCFMMPILSSIILIYILMFIVGLILKSILGLVKLF